MGNPSGEHPLDRVRGEISGTRNSLFIGALRTRLILAIVMLDFS
jgi:hypothetical protein